MCALTAHSESRVYVKVAWTERCRL